MDDYGIVHGEEQIDLFKLTDNLDTKVDFTNVDVARLTLYSVMFAGRKIDSGKLTLYQQYKIQRRQLTGDNGKFDGIKFAAGSPTLTPLEREELSALAARLMKHPKRAVTLHET